MKNFRTRPHFEDRQVVQYSDESVRLSGITKIAATFLDFSGTTTAQTAVTIMGITGYLNDNARSYGLVVEPPLLRVSGGTGYTSVDVTGYVLKSLDSGGTVTWAPVSVSADTNTFVTGGTVTNADLTLTWNTGGSATPIDLTPIGSNGSYLVPLIFNQSITTPNSGVQPSFGSIVFDSGATYSSILGGTGNRMYSDYSSIGGGAGNSLKSDFSVIGGGKSNQISASTASVVSGGEQNTIIGSSRGSILGGKDNLVRANYGIVGGGRNNDILDSSYYSSVFGGAGNIIDGSTFSFIGGGGANYMSGGNYQFIGGGKNNQLVGGNYNTTVGGYNNVITGASNSTILGGINNTVLHNNSHIIGSNLNSISDNTTHVDGLNINTVETGTSISFLAISSDGTVIKGNDLYGEVCSFCSSNVSGDTLVGTGVTETNIINTDESTIESTVPYSCTQWCAYQTNGGLYASTLDYGTAVKYELSGLIIKCCDGDSGDGGTDYGTSISGETTTPGGGPPTVITGLTRPFVVRKAKKIAFLNAHNSDILNSNQVAISNSTLGRIELSTLSSIDSSFNSEIYGSNLSSILSSENGFITNSSNSTIISSQYSTLSGVTGSTIIGGNNITGTDNDTVYVPKLNIDTLGGGTSINNLGIDVNGNIVNGSDTNLANTNLTQSSATRVYNIPLGYRLQFKNSSNFNMLELLEAGDEVIINSSAQDIDFRAAGLTDGNLLRTDAANDRVGIGIAVPTEKLHVVGSVRIVDGTQQSGYVLTSDANGVGSWQVPSGGGIPEATTATTTTINFTGQTIYYNAGSPATGNISDDLTGAKLGLIQKIYHNDGTEPTYPGGWVLMGDAIYFTSTLNIIYAEWAGGSRVEYWYVQEQ